MSSLILHSTNYDAHLIDEETEAHKTEDFIQGHYGIDRNRTGNLVSALLVPKIRLLP
jgi:hypothetical protein